MGWHYRINGSITECDVERFVEMGIHNGPSGEELEAHENQSVGVTAEADETDSEEPTELTGYGTYIYSPVWIDGRPTRSFQEKVFDVPSMEWDLVFEDEFRDRTFRVRKDGYLFVEADDAETALRIFNTIFGTAFFFGRSWQAVQRDGLGSVTIRSEPGMQTRTSSGSVSTPRRMLESWSDSPLTEFRGELSTERLKEILDASESIYEAEDLREKVIFLLQGFTHHLNNEFSPAFLLTWILIEQHLNDRLDQQLRDEHGVNRERRKSITDGRSWYISQNIELLEIIDGIDEDDYEELSRFRKKRNAIVHKMDTATEADSEGILNLAARFIVSEFPSEVEIPEGAV